MESQEESQYPFSRLLSILLSGEFSAALAMAITEAVGEEEKIPKVLKHGNTPSIFMTRMDSKIDDKIYIPLEGTVWDQADSNRPKILATTHPNYRCFWIDAVTGQNMGQF
jgi:hypothetical protein